MPRRFVLACLLTIFLASTALAADKRPNVLFLITDDQRADTIAALGNDVIHTPNLDRLVREGFTFTSAYCMGSTSPAVCNPSRHQILSGMSLYRYQPKKRAGTIGDVFRKAGYVTYQESKRGNVATEYHKAFEFSSQLNDERERTSGHHGRTVADHAVAFMKDQWNREKPLLMCLEFEGPHDPRVAAEEWMKLYDREKLPLPANLLPHHPIDIGSLKIRDEQLAPWPRTEAVVREHLHDYYGCISSLDHNIGRILAQLEELGERENTIICFTSDHGLAIGSHGLFGKQNLYEHSMRSPLVFCGPGVPRGTASVPLYLFDIFPTLCDLASVDAPQGLDGKSFAPVMRGKEVVPRTSIFLAYMNLQRALQAGDWKLIRYPQVNATQLFNLRDDPHETKNLAGDPQYKEQVDELLKLLATEQTRWGDKQPLTVAKPRKAEVDLSFFAQP